MDHLKLTVDVLSVDAVSNLVVDDSCGAVSIFVGTTRDNFEGKKVLKLEYEAYEPMALKAMKGICDEVRDKWPAVHGIAIYHRLGDVPCREASIVIAVSSPHRRDSLDAVSYCIERVKATVPVWKREVYAAAAPVWKENRECLPSPPEPIDTSLVQITVSDEELQQRIQRFIERKRSQADLNNVLDFAPDSEDSCARTSAKVLKRQGAKSHLTIRKVHNEWGPQTARGWPALPAAVAERVGGLEDYLNIKPVSKDIYERLKEMEDRIAALQAVSPEYAHFWKGGKASEVKSETVDYTFSAEDIAKKIEQLESQGHI